MKIIGQYRITYQRGITQTMDLISQEDFENIIKVKLDEIYDFQVAKNNIAAALLKKEIKDEFGDNYFTTGSPIYKAFETGILSLPAHQGGEKKCKVEKL